MRICNRDNSFRTPSLVRLRAAGLLGVAALLVGGAPSAKALTIVPTFNSSLSPTAVATIQHAIAFYESTLSDPIVVPIEFHNMSSGLGASNFIFYSVSYSSYRQLLLNDAKTPDDATALATIPANNGFDPVLDASAMNIHSANGRAVGFNTPAVPLGPTFCGGLTVDGCIGLNLSITDDATGNGQFSLLATVEHEIDEVLGLGSSLTASGITSGRIFPEDLFRYAGPGVRSFHMNPQTGTSCNGVRDGLSPAPAAFFSIDGGVTNLDQFNNCNDGGDYGDWITHTPSQVQDAFTNGSARPFLTAGSPEVRALDVIGFDVVPEPSSLVLVGTGLMTMIAGVTRKRSKNG